MNIKKSLMLYAFLTLAAILTLSCAGTKQDTSSLPGFVPVSEEIFMGTELSKEYNTNTPLVNNEPLLQYLNDLADSLSRYAEVQSFDCKVYVVDMPDLNHFSFPGGHIYIYRGLIEASQNLNEIVFVISHEIAHISARDGLERIYSMYPYAFAAQSVLGYNPEITTQIIEKLFSNESILNYGRESELSADEKAIEYTFRANYNPKGIIKNLENINTAILNSPSLVSLMLKTHPLPERRLSNINQDIDRLVITSTLVENTPEFTTLKSTLSE